MTGTIPAPPDPAGYRRYQWATAGALLLLAVGAAIGIAVPAGLGWDFANFYDTGRRAAAGLYDQLYDPSSSIAGAAPQGSMQFWGAPISALFYVPLAALPPATALLWFKVENTLALALGLVLLFRHVRRFADPSPLGQWRFAAVFATLALLYQPFWTVYRVGGQTTPSIFLLLVLALLSHQAGRDWLTASLLVPVVAIKPAFVLLFGFLALVSGVRFLLRAALVSLIAAGLAVLAVGWGPHQEFLRHLMDGLSRPRSWQYSSSLYTPFDSVRLLPGYPAFPPAWRSGLAAAALGVKAVAALTVIGLVWRSRSWQWTVAARRHFRFAMAVLFFLLVSQVLWEHYLAVLFLVLGYLWASRRWFPSGAGGILVAIAVASLGQNFIVVDVVRHAFVFESAPAVFVLGVLKAAPLLLTLVLLWRHGQALLRSHAAPAWST
jgi:hypothetical protein